MQCNTVQKLRIYKTKTKTKTKTKIKVKVKKKKKSIITMGAAHIVIRVRSLCSRKTYIMLYFVQLVYSSISHSVCTFIRRKFVSGPLQ